MTLLKSALVCGAIAMNCSMFAAVDAPDTAGALRYAPAKVETAAKDEIPGPWVVEGTPSWYIRNSQLIGSMGQRLVKASSSGTAADIYFNEDGTVYINRPINNIYGDAYMKGTLNEDKTEITLEFPQNLWQLTTGENVTLYLLVIDGYVEGSDIFLSGCSLADRQTYHFDVAPDGTISTKEEDKDLVIGWWSSLWGFERYGDFDYSFIPQHDEPLTAPEGLSTSTCAWVNNGEANEASTFDGIGNYCQIGFDNDDVWVQGISGVMPEAWLKGTKKADGSLTFDSMQLLGLYYPENGPMTWLYAYGADVEEEIPGDPSRAVFVTPIDEIALKQVDGGYKNEGYVVTNNIRAIGDTFYTSFDMGMTQIFTAPDLIISDKLGKAATPQAPELLLGMAFAEDMYYMHYAISQTDTDGNLMDPAQLFYEVFVDDELFTFDPEMYGVPGDGLSLIPYRFCNEDQSIFSAWQANSPNHDLIIFGTSTEIGVRAVYTAGGERNESEIVKFKTSGMQDITVDSDTVSVRYFTVTGTEASADYQGICIKVEIKADGSVKTSKVIRR